MPTVVGTPHACAELDSVPGRVLATNEETDEDFTGYEQDDETGLLYGGARYYMAALGRFGVTDRFADKEPMMTPYQYAANNPVYFVDVNADSVDVSNLSAEDQRMLVQSLQKVTGLSLSIAGRMLIETPSAEFSIDGNSYNVQLASAYGSDGVGGGSKTAALMLSNAMTDSEFTTGVQAGNKTEWEGGPYDGTYGGIITLDFETLQANQIDFAKAGFHPDTFGVGMGFIHEVDHTPQTAKLRRWMSLGSGMGPANRSLEYWRSGHGPNSPTIPAMNNVRSELGSSYGQRAGHRMYSNGRFMTIPWRGPNGKVGIHSSCRNRNDR